MLFRFLHLIMVLYNMYNLKVTFSIFLLILSFLHIKPSDIVIEVNLKDTYESNKEIEIGIELINNSFSLRRVEYGEKIAFVFIDDKPTDFFLLSIKKENVILPKSKLSQLETIKISDKGTHIIYIKVFYSINNTEFNHYIERTVHII